MKYSGYIFFILLMHGCGSQESDMPTANTTKEIHLIESFEDLISFEKIQVKDSITRDSLIYTVHLNYNSPTTSIKRKTNDSLMFEFYNSYSNSCTTHGDVRVENDTIKLLYCVKCHGESVYVEESDLFLFQYTLNYKVKLDTLPIITESRDLENS
jgi:hypothetical protein